MKRKGFLILLALAMLFTSCGNKEKFVQLRKNLKVYDIERSTVGLSPRVGDLATLNITIKAPNDSVIRRAGFFRVQIEKAKFEGSINHALMYMHEGDSVAFLIDAINYFKYDAEEVVPEFIKPGDVLRFDIRMTDVTSIKEFQKERQMLQISGLKKEAIVLEHFLKQIGITDSAATNRIFVKHLRKGNGVTPQDGQRVTIDYFGYLVDGSAFDNSYERGIPFSFDLNSKDVIEGLEMGVKQMQVGGKATIVIPSPFAYGEEGLKPVTIAPYTTLVFDAELNKVK